MEDQYQAEVAALKRCITAFYEAGVALQAASQAMRELVDKQLLATRCFREFYDIYEANHM